MQEKTLTLAVIVVARWRIIPGIVVVGGCNVPVMAWMAVSISLILRSGS